jgi:callose synthase
MLFLSLLRTVHGLVACYPDDVEPKSKEARRRLTFFVNTLFMDMPDAPSIHDMFSWNVLTPFYSEDVTYNKVDLEKRTDELGVSTLLYLQTLYRADWNNFMERMGLKDDEKIWSKKYIDETRLWASLRAQTLTRTVNGMMYFEKALRLLANLERLDDETTNDLMGEKFGYIVACQVYGRMKKEQDPKADDIDKLMHRHPHMRVAYIDTVRLNRSGDSLFYSVLVKSDRRGGIQEVYRVRLPGNPILGEGKPENQNHALIFSRGEFIQTIDMNQEGYFEEALKMRNALQEFAKREGPLPTTILGLREHIFTGSVSSLANYMALQETSFVTLGQRVLANPLFIRLHYGHPDVFDKLFFMTRGGISKSSKGINLSEDIFAGYNNVVRGGQVAFKEYLQVGKGRDVGMSQIYKFEAKLSQGAAEQSLSRDIYRVCHRLDFCRLLSLYYGGIGECKANVKTCGCFFGLFSHNTCFFFWDSGHYFSNVLTVLTVYLVVYLMAILALYDLEKIGERVITPMGTIQMLLGGLGLLQTIPLFATLGVERGWWPSAKEIFQVFVTGGPLHFMFHIQTKAYYMSQTILVGGAKYRPTGRGFVTQHTPFDEQYRFFASSHLYLGVELGAGLVLMGLFTDAGQYFGRTWSLWLASVSFLASPFWFNPLSFDWNVVVSDYDKFLRWMQCNTGGASKSWNAWWVEENNYWKGMKMEAKNVFIIKAILYAVIGEGIRRSDLLLSDITLHKPLIAVSQIIIFLFVLLGLGRLYMSSEQTMPYPLRRTTGILICVGLMAGVLTIFVEDTNFLRYALAGYYGFGALCQLGLLMGIHAVKPFYLIHDYVCGHIIFIPLFLLSALQLPHYIQTWLLYHNALSSDVVVSDILRYARKTQETAGSSEPNDDLVEQVAELRKIVQKQEDLLNQAGLQKVGSFSEMSGSATAGADNNVPARIMAPTPLDSDIQPQRRDEFDKAKRVMSMSGIDVWSDMAGTGGSSSGQDGGSAAYQGQSQGFGSGTLGGFSFTQPDTMPPR